MATQIMETVDAWGEVTSRPVATQPWTCSETQSEDWTDLPTQPKPTRAHRAAIAELGLRFQPANSADLDAYSLRLELLAKDCAHIAVPLLRAACDRAARDAKGLPYASEILRCATAIVEERQRVRSEASSGAPVKPESREEHLRELARSYNRDNALRGSTMRWTDDMQAIDLSDKFERRICTADGQVMWP